MTITKFFTIAYRNLIRNGRRTALTALAVALGLVVVMAISALLAGMLDTMLADTVIEGMAFGTTMYGGFAPDQFIILSLLLLVIVLLASLYPAWYAARIEPVEALLSPSCQ
ncbi:MAG: hypothetical protein B6242_04980 [Anaerolineaceae bacterium 4572_78]|nr:MAG: hypothetical protein B6242_04980 [Anaerolineaceae bacterium 4572_78]